VAGIVVALAAVCTSARAGDWPQWRYDAGRGAASPDRLPTTLHLMWRRQLAPPRPAWPPSQPSLRFDVSYSPVAAGKTLFVPSMVSDSVTAYETDSGRERWRFYTEGPVRFAPVVHNGRVYFTSDDGCLYCVDATDGTLQWRFRGGPTDRKVLGNERLISTWPIRGGPVLLGKTVYFTAGIWPFMGIFVHAVNAETGTPVWTNSGEGSTYMTQPHNSPAFGGLVPRGHLAATEHGLIAPGGRTSPGCYDLRTGALRYFHYAKKGGRSSTVTARGPWFFHNEARVRIADGRRIEGMAAVVHDDRALYALHDGALLVQDLRADPRGNGLKGKKQTRVTNVFGQLFLKAGSQFVVGETGKVGLITVDATGKSARVVWKGIFLGTPWTMLAADGKLFVVTVQGEIYCFGGKAGEPKRYVYPDPAAISKPAAPPSASSTAAMRQRAESMVRAANAEGGYAAVFGLGTGRLAEQLLRVSKLRLVVIDPDSKKIDAFRRRMDAMGVYGNRVSAHVGDPIGFPLPPYMASLVVTEDSTAAGMERPAPFSRSVFRTLRPYGGTAWVRMPADQLRDVVEQARLETAEVKPVGDDRSLLVRSGALPGAGDWTHQYADAGNSVVSQDALARAPLGLLWFGNGPPNDEVLPRHGHGPSPQVAAGRLVIEGRNMLRAVDVYTGRLLWQRSFPELGRFYDHTGHQPGAGEIGSNYVSLADSVYVVFGEKILRLDAASGKTISQFNPPTGAGGRASYWGYVGAWKDALIATSMPVATEGSKVDAPPSGVDVAGMEPLVKRNENWQYLAGADPVDDWTAASFDAKGWKTGQAGFGYGDGDDRTVLAHMRGKFTRIYLRKTFAGTAAVRPADMVLAINYDDAFIAYLNGKEVARSGIGRGRGKSAAKISSHEAKGIETFPIRGFRELLRPGKNVLAIEGHNVNRDSSDFSLDPYLLIRKGNGTPAGGQRDRQEPSLLQRAFRPVQYSSASKQLVAMDRFSGKVLWSRDAKYNFRHNNVAVGTDKVFCIDGLSRHKQQTLKRRGTTISQLPQKLAAIDVRTGREVWSTTEDVFGTFLSYSAQHDVLLQAGSAYRDRAADESDVGMVAYRGRDGKVIWKNLTLKYGGPCMLLGEMIVTQDSAYHLLTGKPKMRKHPLTGTPVPWRLTRNYGCNTAIAGQHLITFRSAAAGYYDLATDGGTGNFGGFKSSCTSNLIVAGGLVNAPEYTRTCTCNYQNQTSLALVHDPDVEVWTFNSLKWDGQPVRRVGINFGAPGDRRTDDGTLWLDYPSRGGPSPDIPVEVTGEKLSYFRLHSSRIQVPPGSGGLSWVASSGVSGVRKVKVTLAAGSRPKPRRYTVRLHFAETKHLKPGDRVFSGSLQGTQVIRDLDLIQHAGPRTAVVREFRGIEAADALTMTLTPKPRQASSGPTLSGIEILAEGR